MSNQVKGNYAVVVGNQHAIIKSISQKLLRDGWTIVEVIADGEGHYATEGGCSSDSAISYNPWNEQSIEKLLDQLKKVTSSIDLLVCCFDDYRETHLQGNLKSDAIMSMYEANVLVLLRTIEILLPLMVDGLKRIIVFAAGKALMNEGTGSIGYDMSLAARRMSVKIMTNALQSEGYSIKLIDDMESDALCQQL